METTWTLGLSLPEHGVAVCKAFLASVCSMDISVRLGNMCVAVGVGEVDRVCLAWEDEKWSERVKRPSLAAF